MSHTDATPSQVPSLLHTISALLGTSLVLAAGLTRLAAAPEVDSPAVPIELRCEYQKNPLGLDVPRPRLSWQMHDERRGAKQTAYRILVASSPDLLAKDMGDLWDSGRVQSDQSTLIPYGGKPLASRQRCWWKVRIWDADGRPSRWSAVAWWEMALLKTSDWKARWISPAKLILNAEPIPLGPWYWLPDSKSEPTTAFFRTVVTLSEEPLPHFTVLAVTADDAYELWVNGKRVGGDGDVRKAEVYTAGAVNLHTGKNVIAVKVTNKGGEAGFALGICQSYYGGERRYLQPSQWLCSTEMQPGWNTPKFQPKGWKKAKVVAQPGGQPWGPIAQDVDGPRRSQLLRKEFVLPADVEKARAYVTGLGFYELHINGLRVGDDVFTPGWTQYEKRIQYQVYDVTNLLKIGRNAVGAILGNGWWSSGLGWAGGQERHAKPGENLRFLLQLEITCTDGSKHTVVTDGTWTSHLSPILEDTLYHGETYDARLEQPGWDKPYFKAEDWRPVRVVQDSLQKLCAQRGPTLRVTEELHAVEITEPKPGYFVLDFGQNHPGRPRLTVQAPAGTTIRMVHAEELKPDGTLYRANYRSARVTDTYICKGDGVEVWEPRFTYRGFRYMAVTGLPQKPDRNTVVSRVLHSAPPMAGHFECSNPLLNQIWHNVVWGQRSNMHSVPTDCPQRDERLGWMGDAQIFAPTSMWNMDMALFFTKWTRDILDAQQPDGAVPGVCPNVGDWVIGPGRSAWADAITMIPWYVYVYYGDRQILADAYPGVKKWVEYMQSKLSPDGLYEQPTWGDWVPVEPTPDRPVAAMYGYYSTRLLARMAQILGKQKEAEHYAQLAEKQRQAFNKKYFHPDTNSYVTGTQTSNILPLAFGMVEPDKRQAVADSIAADIRKHNGHHTTGFLGTGFILPTLAQYGYADLAYGLLNTVEFPSIGYMIQHNATTIWERWDTDKQGPGMNSRNHFAFGAMAQWLFEGLAGLRPDPGRPGFKHIVVKPYVVGDLKWVRVEYPTPYGRLASYWQRKSDGLHLQLLIPANTTATVYLPASDPADVTEGGQPLPPAWEPKVERAERDWVVVQIPAGAYRFHVASKGRRPSGGR